MKSVLRFVFAFAMLGTGLLALIVVQLPPNAVTSAQTEPIIVPSLPPSELLSQSEASVLQDDPATWEYRTVYFATADSITAETAEGSRVVPSMLFEGMAPPLVIHNMSELRDLESAAPLEAIVLHPSAYDMIDREWLKPLLRRGVILVTLNIPLIDVAELRNDSCTLARIDQINLNDETSGLDFFYIHHSYVFAEKEDDLQMFETFMRQTCGDPSSANRPPSVARVYGGQSKSQGSIVSDFDLQHFQRSLISSLWNMRSAQRNFLERDLPPTPVPPLPL